MRSVSSSTIRCRQRRNSATKARPTTRGYGRATDEPGIEFFVYGRHGYGSGPAPARFPARQTREASAAVARRHGLAPERVVFAQQNPLAVDAGVFHNDVIAVGHGPALFCHELAYLEQHAVLAELAQRVGSRIHASGRP